MKRETIQEIAEWIIIFTFAALLAGIFLALTSFMTGCGPLDPLEIPATDCDDPIIAEIEIVNVCQCWPDGDNCATVGAPIDTFINCLDCGDANDQRIRDFNDPENGYASTHIGFGVWAIAQRGTRAPNVGRCQSYNGIIGISGYQAIDFDISNPTPPNPQSNVIQVQLETMPIGGCP